MPRPLRLIGLLAAALALGGLVALVLLDPVGRRRESVTLRMAAQEARIEARDPARPTLHGEATPGNAWRFYEFALRRIELEGEAVAELETVAAAVDDEGRGRRLEWLDRLSASLEDLRHGAQAASSRRELEWSSPWTRAELDLEAVSGLGRLSAASGLAAIREGRPSEGVRDLLDGLQFARDLAACPTLMGSTMGCYLLPGDVFTDWLAREGLAGMDEPALDLLEAGLATLESSWPRDLPFMEGETLFLGHVFLDPENAPPFEGPTWRIGILRTVALLDAAESHLDILDETRSALDAPGADLSAVLEGRNRALEESSNPFLNRGADFRLYGLVAADAPLRLRALRALIGRARGRDVEALLDFEGRAIVLEEPHGVLRARFTQFDGSVDELVLRLAK